MGQSGNRVQVGDVVVLETRVLVTAFDGRVLDVWGIPGTVTRTFAWRRRLDSYLNAPPDCVRDWLGSTAAEVAIGDLRIRSGLDSFVRAASRRGLVLRMLRGDVGQKTKPRKLVGRAGLRTSVEGPTLSERDA